MFYSTYCHLASVKSGLSVGDTVARNEPIGVIGNTSNSSTMAVHLHVCVFTANSANHDPMGYCGGRTKTFEETTPNYANEYYYGPDTTKFPNCGGLCFYDPFAVVSTNGAVLRYSDYNYYDVNHDGAVNQLDITRMQRHYGSYDPLSDVDGSGEVGIPDLILIMNNYTS